MESVEGTWGSVQMASRVSTIASMVPDEIIYKHYDHAVRSYETALMFIDVSGLFFTFFLIVTRYLPTRNTYL